MEYVYIERGNDINIIVDHKKLFESKALTELVNAYNKQVKCGIVGVRQQGLYLIALKQEFKARLKESPIYFLEHILGLVGPIEVINRNVTIKNNS